MRRIVIILAVLALMGGAIGAVFASAADLSLPVPPTLAAGNQTVSGPDVTAIDWILAGTDLNKVKLTFGATSADQPSVGDFVKVSVDGGTIFASETVASSGDCVVAMCTVDIVDVAISGITEIDVVVVGP